jgi:oligopeptidase B
MLSPRTFKATGKEIPVAEKRPAACEAHGTTWSDDYAWLRANNWQAAMREPDALPSDIKAYLQAENAYYDKVMQDTQTLQKKLIEEMRGRIKERDDSVPDRDGPYCYSSRYMEGGEHPIYLRTNKQGGEEQILLDINAEAAGHDYFDPGVIDHSPDHNTLAWSCDTSGAEYYTLLIRDLRTGLDYDYVIQDIDEAAWADAHTLFYTRVDDHHRPDKVFRHTKGTDPENDVLVYHEQDTRFFCSVYRCRSGEFIIIHTGMNDQDECWCIPTANVDAAPQLIEKRTPGLEYSVEHQGERFLILTNADEATDFKLVEAPVASPSRNNWKDIIAHKPGRMLLTVEAYRNWLLWMERENALPRICFMSKDGGIGQVTFNEEAYSLELDASLEYATDQFRFLYSSPTTPEKTIEFDLLTGDRTLLKEQEIPSGHDASHYVTRRMLASSHDGAQVPVTVVHHMDTALDGSAPCLLYGYGSYGHSMPAAFHSECLSLVDRGFIYAIAHVRGGQEKGRAWYEDAKFGNKPNSFHDFIAAALALVGANYTSAGSIIIEGASAGGLLVAATLNMRPELFGGAIADVPFVDVLNTILDESLPLTPGEWSQWGNPLESREAFEHIRAYSPYDNVTATNYPPMLVTAGVSDPRVTYWEPAKWVAKLRALKTDDNILLLKTNMSSGHFGKTGRFAELEDAARSYAFAIKAAGKA